MDLIGQIKRGIHMSTITTTDGTQIYYKDWGSGQPIVFSHGWPLSADDWDAQLLFFLHHGYRVIAHDRRVSSAINRSQCVSEYRKVMPESSQAGIRDVAHPELKPTQRGSLLECDVVRFGARPLANSYLVCPARGWNEVVRDCNGWSRI
jgi:hypothetical protein